MADSQQSGSSSSGNQQKSQLSWGQPASQGTANRASQQKTAAAPAGDGASSRLIGVFVAGLIIGLLIAWAWFDLRGTSTRTSATATSTDQFAITQTTGNGSVATTASGNESGTPATTSSTPNGSAQGVTMAGAAIAVAASQPAGYAVEVDSITADQPVWAVVYADAAGTQILGAGRFAARKRGTIELLHPTVAGHTYWVGLVTDTPDHQWGNHVNHQTILGSDGKPVMTQFTAQ